MSDPFLTDTAFGTVILTGLSWLSKEAVKLVRRIQQNRNGGTIETRVERGMDAIAREMKRTREAMEAHGKESHEVYEHHARVLEQIAKDTAILRDRRPW